jgi:DNA-binding NtrC family response regulator
MASILVYEPDSHERNLARLLLEGLRHRVREAETPAELFFILDSGRPDLALFGISLWREEDVGMLRRFQRQAPGVPALALFSGDLARVDEFLSCLEHPKALAALEQPVHPYRLLVQVKNALMSPAEWRNGQHRL